MSERFSGKVDVTDANSNVTITFDGGNGDIIVGGHSADGAVILKSKSGKETARLEGAPGSNGINGRLILRLSSGEEIIRLDASPPQPTTISVPPQPNIILGGKGAACNVSIRNGGGMDSIKLDGETSVVYLGGEGQDGRVYLINRARTYTIRLDGSSGGIYLGDKGQAGDLYVRDGAGKDTIHIDGNKGDIILENADCAEDFDASELDGVEAGAVVVLDQEGKLQQSTEAYDRRVAGVVSGAGDNKPGIVLDKKPAQINRLPLALVGKVFCKADARFGPIEVGDLLTTSPTPGHAMKVDDPVKAFGAVVGKALRPLKSGQGLIPILVALQ